MMFLVGLALLVVAALWITNRPEPARRLVDDPPSSVLNKTSYRHGQAAKGGNPGGQVSFRNASDIELITEWLLAEIQEDFGLDVTSDEIVVQRVREAAAKLAQSLEEQDSVEVNLPFLTADASGPKHFAMKVNRAMVSGMIRH